MPAAMSRNTRSMDVANVAAVLSTNASISVGTAIRPPAAYKLTPWTCTLEVRLRDTVSGRKSSTLRIRRSAASVTKGTMTVAKSSSATSQRASSTRSRPTAYTIRLCVSFQAARVTRIVSRLMRLLSTPLHSRKLLSRPRPEVLGAANAAFTNHSFAMNLQCFASCWTASPSNSSIRASLRRSF